MVRYCIRITLLLLLSAATVPGVHPVKHDHTIPLRIAYIPGQFITDRLLERVKSVNYTYALVPFTFRISDDSVGNGDIYANIRTDVCSLAVKLDRFDLRMIPMIPMSSKWALQWKLLQVYENPAIGVNTIAADNNLPALIGKNPQCQYAARPEAATLGCNSWAPEPDGVDKSMIDLFRAVRDGYDDAAPRHPLEYVHITHDEPQFLNWLLMAGTGAECGTASPYRGNFARTESSLSDSLYITALLQSGIPVDEAYRRLLADELHRRVLQADSVFGPDVRLLFYAESFDNQSWGGVPWHVRFDTQSMLMHDVIKLPGLTATQKSLVKDRLYPMLWNYDGKTAYVTSLIGWLDRKDYDTDAAFRRFADNDFHFLYIGALQNGDASVAQIDEFAAAAKNYPENYLGYCAATWDVPYNDSAPDPKWNILEYIASLQDNTPVGKAPSHSGTMSHPVTVEASRSGISLSVFLETSTHVDITITTAAGRRTISLVNRQLGAGSHTFRSRTASGLQIVRIRTGSTVILRRVTVVR